MKIILAQHFGVCFGVRDAIAQAEQLARHALLTILGELVHNPVVRERLRARDIREGSLEHFTSDSKQVMISAHGASDQRGAAWRMRRNKTKEFATVAVSLCSSLGLSDPCRPRSVSFSMNCGKFNGWQAIAGEP